MSLWDKMYALLLGDCILTSLAETLSEIGALQDLLSLNDSKQQANHRIGHLFMQICSLILGTSGLKL